MSSMGELVNEVRLLVAQLDEKIIDNKKRSSLPRCATCGHWETWYNETSRGICANSTHEPAVQYLSEGEVVTMQDFGCVFHSDYDV